MKLNDYFDRITVINLPERQDRRREISRELDKLGLALGESGVCLFPAIRPAGADDFPSRGAHGAYLSHLEVLRLAQRDGIKHLLVLEDDLLINPRLKDASAQLLEQLSTSSWGIVYFGHMVVSQARQVHLSPTTQPQQCLHFYAVHHSQFAPLIAYLEACLQRPAGHPDGGKMHVDGAISMYRERHPECLTLLVEPSLGSQRPSRSDITNNRWYDRLPLVRELIALARRGKAYWRQRGAGSQP